MIAFFFTMPISITMPTKANRSSEAPEQHQGQQRAHRRRRQAGQDGQRMDEALVQDAQHQVDHEHRQQQQHAHAAAVESWKACAVPCMLPLMVAGRPHAARMAPIDAATPHR